MGIVYTLPTTDLTITDNMDDYYSYSELTSSQKALVDNIGLSLHYATYYFSGNITHDEYLFANGAVNFAGCQIGSNRLYMGYYGTNAVAIHISVNQDNKYLCYANSINGYFENDDRPIGTVAYLLDGYSTPEEVYSALVRGYPITYSYTNSTVSGPSEAAVGDTVTVSAVPDVDYGITDQSTQISVTNNDVAVPFTWDATNQRITFTMPDPS